VSGEKPVQHAQNYRKIFRPFVSFGIILNIVRLHINTREDYILYMRNNRSDCVNMEVTDISESLSEAILCLEAKSLNHGLL
jgi:hypothetical protein